MSNLFEYKGYHGSVEYSHEDGLLIGSVFGIRDSLHYHGTSLSEIEDSFHDCIDTYLEVCAKRGIQPDKEYKGSFNVRISPELHRDAALAAVKAGVSLNQFVQDALEAKVNQDNEPQTVFVMFDTQKIQAQFSSSAQFPESRYSDSNIKSHSWKGVS